MSCSLASPRGALRGWSGEDAASDEAASCLLRRSARVRGDPAGPALAHAALLAVRVSPAEARAARCSVFGQPLLLERVLASGRLSSSDLASCAAVCRSWRAAAAGAHAAWAFAWRREFPAARHTDLPRGLTPRQALVDARRAVAAARKPPLWTLADFTLLVDIAWLRPPRLSTPRAPRPFFSAACHAASLFGGDAPPLVCLLEPGESAAPLFWARCFRDGPSNPRFVDVDQLEARVLVRRRDGALLCLCDGVHGAVSGFDEDSGQTMDIEWCTHPPALTLFRENDEDGGGETQAELCFVLPQGEGLHVSFADQEGDGVDAASLLQMLERSMPTAPLIPGRR